MTPKEYLSQIKRLQTRIDQRQRQYEQLRQQLTAISAMDYSKPVVQSSPEPDAAFTRNVEKLTDLAEQVYMLIAELEAKRNIIIGQIQTLDSPIYSNLLYQRYVECKRLEEISVNMSYSYVHTKRMHGLALLAFKRHFLENDTQ